MLNFVVNFEKFQNFGEFLLEGTFCQNSLFSIMGFLTLQIALAERGGPDGHS